MTQTIKKKTHINLEYIKINFDKAKKENLNYLPENAKDKRLKFFGGNGSHLIETDLYYNSDNCKNETYKIGWHPKSYPKNWLDVQKMGVLAARKSLKTRATKLDLAQFREKFKSQNAVIFEDFIVILDEEFLANFYDNPGKHWKNIKKSLEKEVLNTKQKGSSFTYLFMLHAIAVDTTVYLIKDLEKTPENAQKIRNYLFSCTLHVLLLEQLLPKQVSKENNQKFFLTTVRQKLEYCIVHAILDRRIFKDFAQFFKECIKYYVNKKSILLLSIENLNAIDFRFQRYLLESLENMQQNPLLDSEGTKAQGIDFLRTAIEFPDFPDRTYPKNMFSSLKEMISSSEDNSITGNKKNSRRVFFDDAEFVKTLNETSFTFYERCVTNHTDLRYTLFDVWKMYKDSLLQYEKMLKDNAPTEKLNYFYKGLIISICITIDTNIYTYYSLIMQHKIDLKSEAEAEMSQAAVSEGISVILANLCIIEEMLPVKAGQGTIVLKLKNKCFSFFKFLLEAGSKPMDIYFNYCINNLIAANEAQTASGQPFCLSLSNILFLKLKHNRFLKDFSKYLEKHKQNPGN